MIAAAPRIDDRLVALLARFDDKTVPMAETYRRLGVAAERLGLVRPSYEQTRRIIHELRGQTRGLTAGEVLLDVALRTRPATDLYDLFPP